MIEEEEMEKQIDDGTCTFDECVIALPTFHAKSQITRQ